MCTYDKDRQAEDVCAEEQSPDKKCAVVKRKETFVKERSRYRETAESQRPLLVVKQDAQIRG
jgi:hypothetical protein